MDDAVLSKGTPFARVSLENGLPYIQGQDEGSIEYNEAIYQYDSRLLQAFSLHSDPGIRANREKLRSPGDYSSWAWA